MWQKIANNSILLIGIVLVGWKFLGEKQAIHPQTSAVQSLVNANAPPIDWKLTKPAYDGDTITVRRGGQKIKVRFACIDAPELKQPMGKRSRDYLRSLISSSNGKVGLNVIKSDRYGRSVAEVWIDTPERGVELVQSLMVVTGHAYPYERYKDDCPSWEAVSSAKNSAQQLKVGVWGGNYEKPWEYRKRNK